MGISNNIKIKACDRDNVLIKRVYSQIYLNVFVKPKEQKRSLIRLCLGEKTTEFIRTIPNEGASTKLKAQFT